VVRRPTIRSAANAQLVAVVLGSSGTANSGCVKALPRMHQPASRRLAVAMVDQSLKRS